MIKRVCFLLLCLLSAFIPLNAQFVAPKYKVEKPDTLNVLQQISIRTNSLEWLAAVPNLGIEFALSGSPYNVYTLNLSGRFRWDTHPDYISYNSFNILEGKLELRRYWHTRQRNSAQYRGLERIFSKERRNPRFWRGYYAGLYAQAGSFQWKFTQKGIRGSEYSAGLSLGVVRQLFIYEKNALDLDLGLSAGALWVKGENFTVNREQNVYETGESVNKVLPMLTDVRLALVYRFGPSVKKRYLHNQEK